MKSISTKNIKKQALKINKKALKTTEQTVLNSYDKIEKIQNKTDKLLKRGVQFSENQQNKFFDTLEDYKKMIWKNLNKTLDFFSKN